MLQDLIEKKRLEMISIGMKQGLTNQYTIRLSQELDSLLNQLNSTKK